MKYGILPVLERTDRTNNGFSHLQTEAVQGLIGCMIAMRAFWTKSPDGVIHTR
jgi:hypothetical protein